MTECGALPGGGSFGLIALFIAAAVYFVPTIVAKLRNHHNTVAIFLVNLFLGWSLLGWVAALVWAVVKPPPTSDDSI